MKNVLLFLFTSMVACNLVHGQSLLPPTIGEVYNFEVGDTFEKNCQRYIPLYINGCVPVVNSISMIIVTGRQQLGDTLIYTLRYYTNSEQSCGSNHQPTTRDSLLLTLSVAPVDSPITSCFRGRTSGCDTNQNCNSDTLYMDSLVHHARFYKHSADRPLLEQDDDSLFAEGLGLFHGHGGYAFDAPDVDRYLNNYCDLVYYHKVNGGRWGYFWPVTFVSGIGEIGNEVPHLQIYPNPASDYLHILAPEGYETGYYVIADITGKPVGSPTLYQYPFCISTRSFKPGVYLLKLTSSSGANAVARFVKE